MIRVVTYDLSRGRDRAAQRDGLQRLEPDLVCVVDGLGRLATRRLARRVGLRVAVQCGGRGGCAVLAGPSLHVISATAQSLTGEGAQPDAPTAQAIVSTAGRRFAVLAVRLGPDRDLRARHAKDLLDLAATLAAPVVIGAGLNESPRGNAAQILGASMEDVQSVVGSGLGETYPAPDPVARHDYVFVDPGLEILGVWTPDTPPFSDASDHLPVVVDLALGG